ncbi:MAG: hypothetical protein NTV86_04560 [Planctomycetota bacterium]|nr:hypothetical protein [Planctomycetota bacterium]
MLTATQSRHATEQQKRRGLRREILDFILDYGCPFDGSGAVWYAVRDAALPSYLKASKIVEEAKRWIVLLSRDETTIITMYARRDAAKHIRRKRRPSFHAAFSERNGDWR